MSIGWIGDHSDLDKQLARELTCGAVVELLWVLHSVYKVVTHYWIGCWWLLRWFCSGFQSFYRMLWVDGLEISVQLISKKTSGAGPEVRARLHFYHGGSNRTIQTITDGIVEANKVRTFFRFIFTIGEWLHIVNTRPHRAYFILALMILGVDGLAGMKINLTPWVEVRPQNLVGVS
jgi:hypothetical protein